MFACAWVVYCGFSLGLLFLFSFACVFWVCCLLGYFVFCFIGVRCVWCLFLVAFVWWFVSLLFDCYVCLVGFVYVWVGIGIYGCLLILDLLWYFDIYVGLILLFCWCLGWCLWWALFWFDCCLIWVVIGLLLSDLLYVSLRLLGVLLQELICLDSIALVFACVLVIFTCLLVWYSNFELLGIGFITYLGLDFNSWLFVLWVSWFVVFVVYWCYCWCYFVL